MRRGIALHGFVLAVGCCLTIAGMPSGVQGTPQGLQPDEYDIVALIYNQELSALGNRALFPICIGMPSGINTEPLIRYLRKNGFEISDEFVCEPAMLPGGQHHPKDYPHGLRIFIDKVQHDADGVITMHVETDDLTLRPGEHLAQILRRGSYELKQNETGRWQVAGYKKEYDSAEEKGPDRCKCPDSLSAK